MLFDSRIRDKLRAKWDIDEGYLHRSRNRDFDLRFECMQCRVKDWCIRTSSTAILELLYIEIYVKQISILFLSNFIFLYVREKKKIIFLKNFIVIRSFSSEK